MKAEFEALMKKLEIKSLKSLDKGANLLLEFNIYNDELIAELNRLMKADAEVKVIIEDLNG